MFDQPTHSDDKETARLKGVVKSYTYFNEENGFSVIRLENRSVVVGNLPRFDEGESVVFLGEWTKHPKYGAQFAATGVESGETSTPDALRNFLASGAIKGVGETIADLIVAKFGERAISILDDEPERLLQIEGIGKKKLKAIKTSWYERREARESILFLQELGVSGAYAYRIYKRFGARTSEVVRENPYRLTYEVWGVGFKTADMIARKLGFDEHHPLRVKAGLEYALTEAANQGHCFLPEDELIGACRDLLGYELTRNDPLVEDLFFEGRLVVEENRVYLAAYYAAERGTEHHIARLTSFAKKKPPQTDKIDATGDVAYTAEQREAIALSTAPGAAILTGGPGSGKTTALKGVVEINKELKRKIALAAPTGRAAKRIAEVVGVEAKTIHRLLEYDPMTNQFAYDENQPLGVDLLVVDEASMIDVLLMYSLVRALPDKATLFIVGDKDQLPSVGAGDVLRDLIASDILPVVRLNLVFRQATRSDIVVAAHEINRGELPGFRNREEGDLFFIEEPETEAIPEQALKLFADRLPKAFGLDPREDVQVITPMYRGDAGANNINAYFQERFNKGRVVLVRGERIFKERDRVMQLRNNYEKEVFNGDLGLVVDYDKEKEKLVVDFQSRKVRYDATELDELTLAYAITVHKSQGSEYPAAILLLTTSHYRMLQRNLFYTAITRASRAMVILGEKKAALVAVNNDRVRRRHTWLAKPRGESSGRPDELFDDFDAPR